MARSHRRPRPGRTADAAVEQLLDWWLGNTQPGRQLLETRTLVEARIAVQELIAAGLLAVEGTDLGRTEIYPTRRALTGAEAKAP